MAGNGRTDPPGMDVTTDAPACATITKTANNSGAKNLFMTQPFPWAKSMFQNFEPRTSKKTDVITNISAFQLPSWRFAIFVKSSQQAGRHTWRSRKIVQYWRK